MIKNLVILFAFCFLFCSENPDNYKFVGLVNKYNVIDRFFFEDKVEIELDNGNTIHTSMYKMSIAQGDSVYEHLVHGYYRWW